MSALALCPALRIQLLAQTPDALVATVAVNSPAVPHLIRYSGTLVDGHGYPITVPIDAAFSMYEQPAAAAGTEEPAALWTETQHVTPNEKGLYTVYLGAATPKGLPANVFTSVTAQYLGVRLEGEAELPRTLLVSVPYAFKAGDAQTLGGLPASAYALAGSQFTRIAAASNGPSPDGITNVTTAGGTAGFLPRFSGASSLLDSPIFISGSNVGIGTKSPSAMFQVNGSSALAATALSGTLKLNATGSATTAAGKPSELQTFQASAYNASVHEAVPQTFAWQALPISNDTANASGALGLLFGSGSAAPAATGLSIAKNGVVTFAAGQTFPGTGKGNGTVTGIIAGTDLIGGGTSGNVTLSLNTTKVVTGVTAGTGLIGGGSAGAVTLSLDTTKIPTLTDNPTFTGTITANSKTANKPAVAANGTNGGLGIVASSTTASAGRFSTGSASVPSLSSSTSSSTGGYAIYGTTPGVDAIGIYSNASGAGAYGIYSLVSGGSEP